MTRNGKRLNRNSICFIRAGAAAAYLLLAL